MNYVDISGFNLPFYLISIITALIGLLFHYNNRLVDGNLKIYKNRFVSPKAKWIYLLSFKVPFTWFVEDDNDLTPKGVQQQIDLKKTGMDKYFTPRSFMALKVLIFLIALGAMIVVSTLIANLGILTELLLNIKMESPMEILGINSYLVLADNMQISVFAIDLKVASVFLMLSLYPNFYLKGKLSKLDIAFNKDIPILQMFIILMLRSRKTIGEIIYGLSKVDTPHKEHFNTAYRIYIRSHQAGTQYLKNYFYGHKFGDTFTLLEELDIYSREDTIEILQANLINIINDIKLAKQKNAGSKVIYSQASMAIPFTAVILLGAVPLVIFGMSNMNF